MASILPQITQLEFDTTQQTTIVPRGKTYLYDFDKGQFALDSGKFILIDGKQALEQWIRFIFMTPIDTYEIYEGTDYGTELFDLMGKTMYYNYKKSEVRRIVTETLLKHEDINGVTSMNITMEDNNVYVELVLDTVYGTSQQEVTI